MFHLFQMYVISNSFAYAPHMYCKSRFKMFQLFEQYVAKVFHVTTLSSVGSRRTPRWFLIGPGDPCIEGCGCLAPTCRYSEKHADVSECVCAEMHGNACGGVHGMLQAQGFRGQVCRSASNRIHPHWTSKRQLCHNIKGDFHISTYWK